jgi:hypothetical protein
MGVGQGHGKILGMILMSLMMKTLETMLIWSIEGIGAGNLTLDATGKIEPVANKLIGNTSELSLPINMLVEP